MNAGQHTVKYKREGDYGQLRPYVTPVEYQTGAKLKDGTCEKCVYDTGEHSSSCVSEHSRQQLLLGF